MAHDRGNGFLRQGGGADLDHLRVENARHILLEHRILVSVVDLDPAAAGAGPGGLLADPLHGDGGDVADEIRNRLGRLAVIDDIVIDLVADDEEIVLLGDGDHLGQDALGIDGAGGIVGVDDEDARDRRVVFHRKAQIVQVGVPVVVGVEAIGDGPLSGMGRFGRGVGRIGRRGADDPRFAPQKSIDLLNGVSQAIEEDDIVGGDLGLAPAVGQFGEKLAGLQHAAGRAVSVGAVFHRQLSNDRLHPLRNFLPLGHRVADVLHVGLDTEALELFGDLDNGADFVGQFPRPNVHDVVAHTFTPRFLD